MAWVVALVVVVVKVLGGTVDGEAEAEGTSDNADGEVRSEPCGEGRSVDGGSGQPRLRIGAGDGRCGPKPADRQG